MLNFEFNKIIASVLIAGLVCMLTKNVADIIYVKDAAPAARGYAIKIDGAEPPPSPVLALEKKIDIPALMAKANAAEGSHTAKKCIACHNFNKGEANKIGPLLWQVVGRAKAAYDGYGYSKALQAKGGSWDYESLFAFLHKPSEYAPGTKMSFAGIAKPEDIANVIAFLRSKSDNRSDTYGDAPAPSP